MDVVIRKWPYGSHYYLYINGIQIYDEFGNMKWNTYERAKEIATNHLKSLENTSDSYKEE